jgi:alpha-tubulin suppressor-like RCC1 family protein
MDVIDDENEAMEFNDNKYLYSWGFGKYGQIGLKFANYSLSAIKQPIEEKEEVFLISGGESHSAILTLTSKVYVYGKNYFGQLGLGHNNYVYHPTKIDFLDKIKISKVVCGGDHTLALSEDNNIYSWGLNMFGQLGVGDYIVRKQPVKLDLVSKKSDNLSILSKNEDLIDIAAGAQHSILLTSKNRILTCGFSKYFSLGYESEEDVNIFKPIENIPTKSAITKISAGVYHSGCIVDNESIYIWGKGEVLQYEKPTIMYLEFSSEKTNNSNANNFSPVKKFTSSNLIRELKFGEDTVYVVNKNDELFAMGDNKVGQLGDSTQIIKKQLEKIETPKIKQIAVGYSFAIIVAFDNKMYGWGSNEFGQLGLTSKNILLQPTYLEELSQLAVFKISCGGYHSLGLFNNNLINNITKADNIDNFKSISEIKKNLKINNLNSTIKKDYSNISEKYKFLELMKKKISELENNLIIKDNLIKDLKLKEDEINKKISEEGGKENKKSIYAGTNPRGFDNNFEINLEEIEFSNEEGEIGRGTFGDVRRGIWRKEQVAVKFLKQEMTNSEDNINAFVEECNMLKNLRHPNILLFMGVNTVSPYYFIVTEFCENGNLFELLHQHKEITLNWEEKRRIALEVALGMNYLHSFEPPILHRDLKSMNVLLDRNFQVKIADFGSTKFLEVQMTKQKGTFQWMAPEVIKGSSYTEKADVFSFGIILNELASRQPPYYGVDKKEVARNVATRPDYRPSISRSFPKEWVEIMVRCWDHSASKRPNFAEIIDFLIKMKLTK